MRNVPHQTVNIARTAQQSVKLEQLYQIHIGGGEDYTGSYDIIPQIEAQIMPTEDKHMTDDVNIRAIPYYEVSNPQDGKTVYIGSDLSD